MERDRDGETERQRDRDGETERQRWRDRETEVERDGETEVERDRDRDEDRIRNRSIRFTDKSYFSINHSDTPTCFTIHKWISI